MPRITQIDTIHLDKCRQVIVQQGASQLHVAPADFASLLECYSGNAFNQASNSCRVLRPAREGGGAFSVDDDTNLVVTADAIRELPQRLDRSVEQPHVQRLIKEPISIRATDLDSRTRGWAVTVPSASGRRLRMEVDDAVLLNRVSPGPAVGDIDLYFVENDEGDRVYKYAVLRALR